MCGIWCVCGVNRVCTNQVLVAAVDGQVAQGNGHCSDHLVRVRAQQLHQDGKTFLLTHCGSDVVGPLRGRKTDACCDCFFLWFQPFTSAVGRVSARCQQHPAWYSCGPTESHQGAAQHDHVSLLRAVEESRSPPQHQSREGIHSLSKCRTAQHCSVVVINSQHYTVGLWMDMWYNFS